MFTKYLMKWQSSGIQKKKKKKRWTCFCRQQIRERDIWETVRKCKLYPHATLRKLHKFLPITKPFYLMLVRMEREERKEICSDNISLKWVLLSNLRSLILWKYPQCEERRQITSALHSISFLGEYGFEVNKPWCS